MANRKKLILDLILVVAVSTLYSKNVISLAYHEVMGLILFGLFAVHLIFNRKWISAIVSRLSDSKLPGRTRFLAVLDILLTAAWWLSIVTGVHVGMHCAYLSGSCKSFLPKLPKAVSGVILAAVMVFGCWSVATIGLPRWISAPFVESEGHGPSAQAEAPAEISGNPREGAESPAEISANPQERAESAAPAQSHGRPQEPFSLMNLLRLVFGTASILCLCGGITWAVDRKLKRKAVSA